MAPSATLTSETISSLQTTPVGTPSVCSSKTLGADGIPTCVTIPPPASNTPPADITSKLGEATTSVARQASQVPTTSVGIQASQSHNSTIPNSSSTAVAQKSNAGLSGGSVAGVAIGMLIAGMLIAGGVFFFLSRRQKKRQAASTTYEMQRVPYNAATAAPEKGPTVVGSAVASSFEDLLPQPVADDTITGEVSKIRDNIKNHARTYYHSMPVPAVSIHESGLRDLATATGVSASVLSTALSNPSTRQDALRLVLAWVVLSRATGQRDASLLPADLSRLANLIPGRNDINTAHSTLYSKWKTITGALLQQRLGKNAQDPSRVQAFANTITELDSVLAPFVQGSVDGQRRKNVDMILTRTANFAFMLFSQPGSFYLDFSSGYGGLVAFPALVQTIGDQGQVLRPSRVLIEKEVAA